jgi:hypothetical protein
LFDFSMRVTVKRPQDKLAPPDAIPAAANPASAPANAPAMAAAKKV